MNIARMISRTVDGTFQYLLEAIARIFSPSDDAYRNIGVQPFTGEALSEWLETGFSR
ncbi:MAG: hypothetical protein HC886_18960 [Leptolyngbyaceae cyanobacterium SM1_1_3]|nr:hypothetical protein [Leptolyngbyaceae cyanobacterium SM1_1_3]NJM85589.1 hypothetical protein [Leptolyngbyaceae cyanobacterium RM2_2_21]NJN03427.1 hypothetical protein [Leptolyngbyaceae cyanobacterium RM1_1_2]NJO08810.1 hypothetical protein [Leptolyngbyaceae cyanobacterium SL_1_1]